MPRLSVLVLLPALLAGAFASNLRAQAGAPCANVRATNVAAHVERSGESTRCGFGVQVFGVTISIGGAKCYRYEFLYPAHQECLGAVNEGTACLPAQDMAVAVEHCECLLVGVLGTGISTPKCSCSPAGTAGTIEDAQTSQCHGTD